MAIRTTKARNQTNMFAWGAALLVFLGTAMFLVRTYNDQVVEEPIPTSSTASAMPSVNITAPVQSVLEIPEEKLRLLLTPVTSDLEYYYDQSDGWVGFSSRRLEVMGGESCSAMSGALGWMKVSSESPSPVAERISDLANGTSVYYEAPQKACSFPNTGADSVMYEQIQEVRLKVLSVAELVE